VAVDRPLRPAAGALASGWRRWQAASDNRRIFGAMLVVGGAMCGVKVAAMAKDLVVASWFGTNNVLDAYLMALVLPAFVVNLVVNAFGSALIPAYIELRDRRGKDAADEMLSSVMLLSTGMLCGVTGLVGLGGPHLLPWLAGGFDAGKLALTTHLFYLMLPSIAFSGIATVWASVLRASEQFALAELSDAAVPVFSAIALITAGHRWGISALAVGLVVGYFVKAGLLAWGGHRAGLALAPRWHGQTPEVRQVIGQYLPMLAGGLFLGTAPLIDQAMAATLSPGSVAKLSYGVRVVAPILAVGAMSIGTAILPYFSRMIAAGDMVAVRHTLKTYTKLILLVTVPVTVALVLLSDQVVHVIFERGAFTTADTREVSRVQAMAALQIPFYVLGILFVRLISSMKANQILMFGTVISFVVNLSMDYLLMHVMGVAGIALSTTFVYACSLGFLATMLHRHVAHNARG
jgi:putative peptidoglycan lipid II flippase